MAFEFLWIFFCHKIQPFLVDSAYSSKRRADLLHPDFTSKSQLSLVWSITEYPMRQSRMWFPSSCPKPLLFSKASGIIRTLLYLPTYPSPKLSSTPVWSGLPETQRDPSHLGARNHAGAAAGLGFKGQGAHTGQWGYTNMQSIYFWGFFSFVLWFIFFFIIKPLQTLLWLSAWAQRQTFPYPS